MDPYMQIRHKKPGKFRVGDRVRLRHMFRGAIGEVVEDRGNLGPNGGRIYSVKVRVDDWNELTPDVDEDSLEPVEPTPGNGKE